MFQKLIQKSRSYRRFDEAHKVDIAALKELIDLARCSPSGANLQPLKYILVNTSDRNKKVFDTLGWAGYLKDWSGPGPGERPSAYVIILGDKEIRKDFGVDHGIAAQSIMLGAAERGLGGCMIASVKREQLQEALQIPAQFEILLVLALGKPVETVKLEQVGSDGDIKYWRDAQQVHHVPKRALEEIIIKTG